VRSLTATRFADAEARGVINKNELRASHAVNGHTGTTSKDFYVKRARLEDAKATNQAWKKVRLSEGSSTPRTIPTKCESTDVVVHGFTDWGRDHPTMKASTDAKRAEWSQSELEWIELWANTNLPDGISGAVGTNNGHIRKCLEDIIRDKEARRLFHPLHVADSGRLRHGFRKLQ
jgi:hypothetical protein